MNKLSLVLSGLMLCMSLIGCSSIEPTGDCVVDDDCDLVSSTEQNTCACTTDDLCELALGEGYFATTLAAVRFAHRAWATKTVKKAKSVTLPMAVNASRRQLWLYGALRLQRILQPNHRSVRIGLPKRR